MLSRDRSQSFFASFVVFSQPFSLFRLDQIQRGQGGGNGGGKEKETKNKREVVKYLEAAIFIKGMARMMMMRIE